MISKFFCGLFLLVVLFGCQNRNNTSVNEKPKEIDSLKLDTTLKQSVKNVNPKNYDSSSKYYSCSDLLTNLVKKSNYNPSARKLNFNVYIDQVKDSIVSLGLTIKNNERNEDVALGWLEINLKDKRVSDVTIDPDNPVILNVDTIILANVLKHCKF